MAAGASTSFADWKTRRAKAGPNFATRIGLNPTPTLKSILAMTPQTPSSNFPPPKRCLEQASANSQSMAILFHADDGKTYSLSTAQFLHLTIEPNPADASERDHSPELARLVFSSGNAEVRGSGLGPLHDVIAAGTLRALCSVPPRYRGVLKSSPFIHSIRVTLTE